MGKKKSDTLKIEINKKNLITIIGIVLIIVVLGIICFVSSSMRAEKYASKPDSVTLDDADSGDDSLLVEATKQAGEVSDEERKEMTKITVDQYLELYKADRYSVVLLSKDTCSYCQLAIPILENIVYNYDADIKYIDVASMSEDDVYNLVKSDDVFNEGYGTPFLMVVGQNEIKDNIDGLSTKDGYIEFLKKYKFIGEKNE